MQRMYPQDLKRFIGDNKHLTGLFLERIRQLSLTDFVFDFNKGNHLFVSLNNLAPFVIVNPDLTSFPSGGELHSFAVDLRRFLSGRLTRIYQVENDMALALEFSGRNKLLENETLTLIFELIPRHPQAVLLGEEGLTLAAFHYNHESGKDGRLIRRGLPYSAPQRRDYRSILTSEKTDYFSAYLAANSERIKKQNFRDAFVYLELNIKRLTRLIENFISDLAKLDYLPKLYNDATALLTEKPLIRSDFVEIYGQTINVNTRLDAIGNAEVLFKRAKKIKKSEQILNAKITETEARLTYLKNVLSQLNLTNNEDDIKQIYEELNLGKINAKKQKQSKLSPYYFTYENTLILFGRNNKQNDFLTFKIARKNDVFMHIRNVPGAHIIINTNNPSKSVLEFAGNLALFLSKKLDGEVTYTPVNKLKKGHFPGQVLLSSEQTFFLRYDESLTATFKTKALRYL